ncbi:MAG: cytochrome c [Acidimicrobiales bacterium]
MTEIPEHLLRRSKERREALGLSSGGAASGDAPDDTPPATPSAAGETPSTEVAPAPAPAAAPAPAEPPPPPPPPPPYVQAALDRRKIPVWALPVLAVLPIWGFIYAGSLSTPEEGISDPELVLGQDVYKNCAGCHGGSGEGGSGRPLSGGDVLLTFPDLEGHMEWIAEGSALVGGAGNPYGDPARPGGQRVSGSDGFGQMAGWGDQLSEEEIRAVARYEREVLSGGEPEEGEGGGGGESEGEAEQEGGSEEDGGDT